MLKHDGVVVRFGIDGPRLNPFALAPEERNIEFVYRLIRLLLLKGGAVLQPSADRDLFERVRSLFELPLELRRLKHLILSPELQPYLSKWIEGGVYGKVFDNIEDELTLKRIVSFDFQGITSEQADLMEPLLFWIKWQIANVTHDAGNLGVPKLEVYDEVWKHMQDPGMLSMMISSGKTAGKHLGGIILATQAADDLGAHSRVIRNSCSDTLFLGGPFDREQFAELFGLHERQLDLISSLQRGESLLVRAGYSKVLVLNVDDESAWHYTTQPKDRQRRELAIQKHGRKDAFKHLMAEAIPK